MHGVVRHFWSPIPALSFAAFTTPTTRRSLGDVDDVDGLTRSHTPLEPGDIPNIRNIPLPVVVEFEPLLIQ